MTRSLDDLLVGLAPVSLPELEQTAALLERAERKYVVGVALLCELVAEHAGDLSVLTMDERHGFRYRTTYFDTDDLALHRAGATGRRHRAKVRTRQYLDAGTATVEVKAKDGRGRTVKHRLAHDPERPGELGDHGMALVRDTCPMPIDPLRLAPVLATSYRRTTLLDADRSARCTIDIGVRCDAVDGGSVGLDAVIVETKSVGSTGPLDRWLWHRGVRPVRISKYSTSLGLLRPELPHHKWHATLTRTDGWTCRPGPGGATESAPAA